MTEPIWLTVPDAIGLHSVQLVMLGGPAGVRDRAMLASAIARPRNKWSNGETDMAALGGAYAFGIVHTHPFVDGNKRAAFAATMVFLRINGVAFKPDPGVATAAMQSLAAGQVDEDQFARWIRDTLPKAERQPYNSALSPLSDPSCRRVHWLRRERPAWPVFLTGEAQA